MAEHEHEGTDELPREEPDEEAASSARKRADF